MLSSFATPNSAAVSNVMSTLHVAVDNRSGAKEPVRPGPFRVQSGLNRGRFAAALLFQGGRSRAVRATEYNEQSSRSHAILQLSIEVEIPKDDGRIVMRKAKLNLVDLAGSEKWGTGEKDKDTKKELVKINSSLAALGNCISALATKSRKHIPYRESPLTRLLQDSLGGGTRTIVIATVSPHPDNQEESASTLQFANRATRIAAKIQVNEVVNDAVLLKRAQREISRLKQKLSEAMQLSESVSKDTRKGGSSNGSSRDGSARDTNTRESGDSSRNRNRSAGAAGGSRPPLKNRGKKKSNDPLEHSLTDKELKKMKELSVMDLEESRDNRDLDATSSSKLEVLESKFERREADLLKVRKKSGTLCRPGGCI